MSGEEEYEKELGARMTFDKLNQTSAIMIKP